jgi:hypothetical protein
VKSTERVMNQPFVMDETRPAGGTTSQLIAPVALED